MKRLLFILLLTGLLSGVHAQKVKSSGVGIGAEYSFSDNLSSLGITSVFWKQINYFGILGGFFGGPAWGNYGGEIPNSEVLSAMYSNMNGNVLENYEIPEETDGGFSVGGKLMVFVTNGKVFLALGPRLNYFSRQEISVYTVSSDSSYEYYQYTQVPYKEGHVIPGLEANLLTGAWTFNYAISLQPDGLLMHTVGMTRLIN